MQDEKPWECRACDYKSNIKGNLRLHMLNVHKMEMKTQRHLVQDPSNIILGRTNARASSTLGGTGPKARKKRVKTGNEDVVDW